MTMHELFFLYDRKHCKQVDGLAMSFPLELTIANPFICHFENIWLENCLTQYKPVLHRSYADYTFLIFCSTELGYSMERFHLEFSSLKPVFKRNRLKCIVTFHQHSSYGNYWLFLC